MSLWILGVGWVIVIPLLILFVRREHRKIAQRQRMDRSMWDSRVQAWVAEGVSKGYAVRAGAHLAYDGHTKVHTLVLQTTAVKRLHEPQPEETHGR